MKVYTIQISVEIKAKSLKDALEKLEPLTQRKKFKVVRFSYNGARR